MLLTAEQFSLGVVAMAYCITTITSFLMATDKEKLCAKNLTEDRWRELIQSYKVCLSKNIMDVVYGNSLSYFPSKILELLDVFDAMTDHD
jgi:hypothetical protein